MALGKGKSRSPMKRVLQFKQRAAAEGRQPSQGVTEHTDAVEATSSVEAARARLHVWTRKQGLGSTVSGPEAVAQPAEADQAFANQPPHPVKEATRQSKRQIREPYAQAFLKIPKQLASRAKRSVPVRSHNYMQTNVKAPKRAKTHSQASSAQQIVPDNSMVGTFHHSLLLSDNVLVLASF